MNTHMKIKVCRGYALLVVLMVLLVVSVLCATMLSLVTSEMKLVRRNDAIAELKKSTDVLLNYAASQAQANPRLVPEGLVVAPGAIFSQESRDGSLVVEGAQEVYATPLTRIVDSAGLAKRFYINPNAPVNRNDDLRDKNVYRDLLLIASKSAVRDPSDVSKLIEEYACLVVERRQFSVFNYLAFFDVSKFRVTNPGSNIVLDGPIQSNIGVYFESKNHSSTVYMDSTVFTPGDFDFSGSTYAGRFMITDGTLTSGGAPRRVDLLKPGTSVLRESSDGMSFNNFMLNDTKGFLKTGAVGGPMVELDGLNYVDDSANSGIPERFKISNNRRIDPPNPELRNSTDAQYADARIAEMAKTAYQAKLYTYVEESGAVTVFVGQAAAESYKAASDKVAWKAQNGSKYVAPSVAAGFVQTPYVERYNDGGTDYVTPSKNTDLARGAIYDSQQKATVAMVDVDLGSLNSVLASGAVPLANGGVWSSSGTTGWNGVMYVDVQNPSKRLSAPVRDKATGNYIDALTKKPSVAVTPESALKVPLPSLNITGTAQSWDGSASNDLSGLTGVRIKNATTVPGSLVGDPGFTLATNTGTYTVGSLNSDGNLATGTTSLQDDQSTVTGSTSKIPAAVFSDKNVVLSSDFSNSSYDLDLYVPRPSTKPSGMSSSIYNAWPFTGPRYSSSAFALDGTGTSSGVRTNGHYQYQRDPGNRLTPGARVMELSAAFIVGDDDNSNKGIHTLLSYLQPFSTSSDTLRMRGSVIGIYKSRYFKAPAGSFNNYYVAPARTLGYSSLLKAGKMPPASPTISSFRRMRQFVITKQEYELIKSGPNTVDAWIGVVGNK